MHLLLMYISHLFNHLAFILQDDYITHLFYSKHLLYIFIYFSSQFSTRNIWYVNLYIFLKCYKNFDMVISIWRLSYYTKKSTRFYFLIDFCISLFYKKFEQKRHWWRRWELNPCPSTFHITFYECSKYLNLATYPKYLQKG